MFVKNQEIKEIYETAEESNGHRKVIVSVTKEKINSVITVLLVIKLIFVFYYVVHRLIMIIFRLGVESSNVRFASIVRKTKRHATVF